MKTILMSLMALFLLTAAARAADPRTDTSLDKDWKFLKQDAPGAEAPDFDDATWAPTTLPHTWNNMDGQDGGKNYYRGIGWYRTHVKLTPAADKEYFLYFDGACTVADVYLNGKKVGTHEGAFGAFCFDVTPLLDPKGDNILAVKCNNAKNNHIAPLAGDFNMNGGLYRMVHLLTRNKISISPLDDGIASPGIYVKQSNVSAESADIEITIKVRNDSDTIANATVNGGVFDEKIAANIRTRDMVLTSQKKIVVQPHSIRDVIIPLTLKHPHLWAGMKDPYVYAVIAEVYSESNDHDVQQDIASQPLGLRFFKCDPDKGFFLNGEHYALHGVNRHQDRLDKGWAISAADHEEDYKLMADMGCTAVRLAHYEHAQHFYDLCDKGGMVVWAELCMVNDIDLSPEFAANTQQQLTELIKQNMNHPSICFWSLYNELGFGGNDTKRLDVVKSLNALAHKLDDTRLTVGACNQAPTNPMVKVTDVDAFNRYDGWYGGSIATWPATLDKLHTALPDRAVGIAEYGAGGSVLQHSDNVTRVNPASKFHPSEYQCLLHEAAWKAMSERPWIWGTFLWNFADFAVDSRNEGDTPGRNDKGMVTYDRKTKKDVYYFYQANWTATPVLHINLPETLNYSPTHIKVYSNCETVELFADGKSLGKKTAKDHIFDFTDLTLPVSGPVKIEAATTYADKPLKTELTLKIQPPAPK